MLRRRVRTWLRRHGSDRRALAQTLRAAAESSALALSLLGLVPAAQAAVVFVERGDAQGPLAGFDVGGATGANRSKPAFADLDADGDLDVVSGIAFFGPSNGTFAYYENTGSAADPAFLERSGSANPLDGFDVGDYSAPALVDLDGDGDVDLVSGTKLGTFAFFENTGSVGNPAFAPRTGSANPLDGLDVGSGSTPAFADLDGDGDLDALSGEVGGTFSFFENTGSAASPAFAPRTGSANPLNGLDVVGSSAPTLADLDDDGDLDLASGDSNGTFGFFENTGSGGSPAFSPRTGTANPFAGFDLPFWSAPAFGDLDDDDDLDVLCGSSDGTFAYLENTGSTASPVFTASGAESPLARLGVGFYSAPAFGDLDGDGDLDLLSGDGSGTFTLLENTGSAVSPGFAVAPNPLAGFDVGTSSAPALVDLDADGDLDLASGERYGAVPYFENTGSATSPAFALRTGTSNPFDGLGALARCFADLDGDGDLDAVAGQLDGSLAFLENTGSPTSAAFAPRTGSANPLNGFGVSVRSRPSCADVDGDGDFDVIAGDGDQGPGLGRLAFFENTGSAVGPAFVERAGGALHPLAGLRATSLGPTPSFADLDGDGDLDAISGELYGVFRFFLNSGTAAVPIFEPADGASHPLAGFDTGIGSAPALADLDDDGDLDAISGAYAGGFFYFENTGSAASPAFVERGGTADPLAGLAAPYGRSAPALADLDGDGDLDLVSGASAGTFAYFENTGSAAGPAFIGRSGTSNPFAGFDVGESSKPTLADLDGDGDLDAIAGAYYGAFSYFENTGSAASPAFAQRVGTGNPLAGLFAGSDSAPALVDIDLDGDRDLISGNREGSFVFYENTGSAANPAFTLGTGTTNPVLGLGVGYGSTPAFGDLDADGDLDAVAGERYGSFAFFENTGSAISPSLTPSGAAGPLAGFDVGSTSKPALADIDGDGDLDAFLLDTNGVPFFFENTGSATGPGFVLRQGTRNPLAGLLGPGYGRSAPAFADLDGDGDLDAVSGDFFGTFAWLENTGAATSPAFAQRTGSANPLAGFDVGYRAVPAFADLDDDGDLDLVSGGLDGTLAYFENTGSAASPAFVQRTGSAHPLGGFDLGASSAPTFADVDGDGDLDLTVGESEGAFFYLENTGSTASPAFALRAGGALHPLAGFDAGDRSVPVFADIDGDGDLDAVAGSYAGTFSVFVNTTPMPPVPLPLPPWASLAAALGVTGAAWRVLSGRRP